MRLFNRKSLVTLAFSLVALPLWAAHVDSTDWQPNSALTIGTTQVQPGEYELRAEEGKNELQLVSKGKVIATIPVQWIQLPAKAQSSSVMTDGGKVTQVQFSGRTSAIQVTQ